MKKDKSVPINMAIAAGIYSSVMAVFCLLGYIDLKTVVLPIYLPLFAIVLIIMPLKQFVFCHVFLGGAELGLIAEYAFSRANGEKPNMKGPLANLIIFAAGLIGGILLQVIANRRKRRETIDGLGKKG